MILNKYFHTLPISKLRFDKYLETFKKKKNRETNSLAFIIRNINSQIYYYILIIIKLN